jgi:ABC-type uncharacterized transport system auxiliary subunit
MKPVRIIKLGLSLSLTALLSGCLGGGVSKAGAHGIYGLAAAQAMPTTTTPSALAGHALQVERPAALPALDSTDLLVEQLDGELQVISTARWSAPLPILLQDLLVRQITLAQIAQSVSAGPQAYSQPLRLVTELRSFGLRQEPTGLRAYAELSVRLVCNRNARILRVHNAIKASSASGIALDQAAASLRALASDLAQQTSQWLAQTPAYSCN